MVLPEDKTVDSGNKQEQGDKESDLSVNVEDDVKQNCNDQEPEDSSQEQANGDDNEVGDDDKDKKENLDDLRINVRGNPASVTSSECESTKSVFDIKAKEETKYRISDGKRNNDVCSKLDDQTSLTAKDYGLRIDKMESNVDWIVVYFVTILDLSLFFTQVESLMKKFKIPYSKSVLSEMLAHIVIHLKTSAELLLVENQLRLHYQDKKNIKLLDLIEKEKCGAICGIDVTRMTNSHTLQRIKKKQKQLNESVPPANKLLAQKGEREISSTKLVLVCKNDHFPVVLDSSKKLIKDASFTNWIIKMEDKCNNKLYNKEFKIWLRTNAKWLKKLTVKKKSKELAVKKKRKCQKGIQEEGDEAQDNSLSPGLKKKKRKLEQNQKMPETEEKVNVKKLVDKKDDLQSLQCP